MEVFYSCEMRFSLYETGFPHVKRVLYRLKRISSAFLCFDTET
jgi:hypothetical protein